MRLRSGFYALAVGVLFSGSALALDLFTENFEVDPTANWTINVPATVEASDSVANFHFDYSTVGIPTSPNSSNGDTRALNLQTNVNNSGLPAFMGFSVSPTGQDFSTNSSYKLTFDWWSNYPLNNESQATGTALGSTQLSTFGIGTNGTVAQWPGGAQNSLYFAASTDGGTSADYRVYSPTEAGKFSYQEGNPTAVPPLPDGTFVYASKAGTGTVRNNSNTYYATAAELAPTMPPAEQIALYPQQAGCASCDPPTSNTTTVAGTPAFKWREVEVAKNEDIVTWSIDGLLMATVNLNDTTNNDLITLSGGNIFFGQSDINAAPSADLNRFNLLFTLIDNVKVTTIEEVVSNPDFNGVGGVDAADYTIWRDHFPTSNGTATRETGDANGDGNVDQADYDLWKGAFGTFPGSGAVAASAGVPEPSALLLALICGVAATGSLRRRG